VETVSYDESDTALVEMCRCRADGTAFPPEKKRAIQDYTLRRILEEADHRGLPYQIHTGMTTLRNSNPAFLEPMFKRYPNVRFVLLHTYPFGSEACYLARTNRNVYLDTSWQALQSPAILEKCLDEWIGMVPPERITLSVDATNLEEYYGGQVMTRRVLARVFERKMAHGEFSASAASDIAQRLMADNVTALYF
jgi:uncharacterized protein